MKARVSKVADADYYTRDVAADRHDYYAGHGEAPGWWAGGMAAGLGLHGQVATEAFADLLGNTNPTTGEPLKPRPNLKTLAYDVTFSPVKSVSVLWALADPSLRERIVGAYEAGHAKALESLEQTACVARLGAQGSDPQPGMGFTAATFRHRFSREGDPQLHWHTVLANHARADDGRNAALDGTVLYAHSATAGAVMDRVARNRLYAEGFRFERRNGHDELVGVPARLCRQLSKRRVQVEEWMAERGADGAAAAQTAAEASRKPKQTAVGDVHARWHAETLEHGHDPEQIVQAAAAAAARHEDAGDGSACAQVAEPGLASPSLPAVAPEQAHPPAHPRRPRLPRPWRQDPAAAPLDQFGPGRDRDTGHDALPPLKLEEAGRGVGLLPHADLNGDRTTASQGEDVAGRVIDQLLGRTG